MDQKDAKQENQKYSQPIDSKIDRLKLGIDLHRKGELSKAEIIYRELIAEDSEHVQALHMHGVLLIQSKQIAAGIQFIDKALALQPDQAEALNNRGNGFKELNQLDKAIDSYDRALVLKFNYPEAHYNRGNALLDLRLLDEARHAYLNALHFKPNYIEAFNKLGNVLLEMNRLAEALDAYDQAITLRPDFAEALNNRGNVLLRQRRLDAALNSYDKALSIRPDYAEVLYNRGITLKELRRPLDAVASFDKALAHKPDHVGALNNRGIALNELKRPCDAIESYDRALAIKPNFVEAINNRANALKELNRLEEALKCYDRALALNPDYMELLNNRGNVLRDLGRLNEALDSFGKALALKPDVPETLFNQGNVLKDIKQFDAALESYGKALALAPTYKHLYGTWLHTRMQTSEWSDFDKLVHRIEADISNQLNTATPFTIVGIVDDLQLQMRSASLHVKNENSNISNSEFSEKKIHHPKIRIGYFSADFHEHATAFLMAEMFELHDRNKFEIIAFSFGPASKDPMRRRLERAFDQFIDVRSQSDQEIAELARNLEIDIAIDLKGYTRDCRPGIFGYRCAPVQVNYIGYPGTMAADFIDYIIADRILIPRDSQQFYSEKIAYLPNSYQVNDSKRTISDRNFTRSELGLPQDAFVFCCFNNSYKILPSTFDSWMRILKSTPGSVLWLLGDNPTSSGNLRREASDRGISPERIVFAKRMPLADHLARHGCADLFLDTLPYNAHTTASDALWAGLPVLTQIGKSFAARVAASLLNAIGMSELITTTTEEYEARAIHLATNPIEMNSLKQKLSDNRLSSKLFDTRSYVNGLESAYIAMHERSQAGLKPDHIYVNDIH